MRIGLAILGLIVVQAAARGPLLGDFNDGELSLGNKEKLFSMIEAGTGRSEKEILRYPKEEIKFIGYETQVVAGINHIGYFETPDGLECYRLFEGLDGTIEITGHQKVEERDEFKNYCS